MLVDSLTEAVSPGVDAFFLLFMEGCQLIKRSARVRRGGHYTHAAPGFAHASAGWLASAQELTIAACFTQILGKALVGKGDAAIDDHAIDR